MVGYSDHQYIKEKILIPLELNNTFGSIREVDTDDVMSGYYVGIEPDIKTEDYGSMLATAEDVGIFLRALNDGSLLIAHCLMKGNRISIHPFTCTNIQACFLATRVSQDTTQTSTRLSFNL